MNFQCQRCGACCRRAGFVKITDAETARIAAHLELDENTFIQTLTRLAPARGSLALLDQPNGACYFLDDNNLCRLQAVKPAQCVGYPVAWNLPGWEKTCQAISHEP